MVIIKGPKNVRLISYRLVEEVDNFRVKIENINFDKSHILVLATLIY